MWNLWFSGQWNLLYLITMNCTCSKEWIPIIWLMKIGKTGPTYLNIDFGTIAEIVLG